MKFENFEPGQTLKITYHSPRTKKTIVMFKRVIGLVNAPEHKYTPKTVYTRDILEDGRLTTGPLFSLPKLLWSNAEVVAEGQPIKNPEQ